jgi:hypothetical protein
LPYRACRHTISHKTVNFAQKSGSNAMTEPLLSEETRVLIHVAAGKDAKVIDEE